MTPQTLDREIARLKTEWPDSFGEARKLALWDVYRDVQDDVFHDAVTRLVLSGNPRYPPRLRDFEEAVEEERRSRRRIEAARTERLPAGDTREAKENRERVKAMCEELYAYLDDAPARNRREREEREQARREDQRRRLRLLSPQERAAGEGRDDE